MRDANRLKNALEGRKGPSMGAWQLLPGTNLSRILARSGFDWIMVDCEHGNIDGNCNSIRHTSAYNTVSSCKVLIGGVTLPLWTRSKAVRLIKISADAAMHECVATIASCAVSPIVRIPDFQGWMMKRALDSGAHGILAPLLRTAQEAEAIVMASKFPPIGRRGFGSPFPMERFSPSLTAPEYLQQANSAILTAVQIETREALENVDSIAAVDGVDVLFVGPYDLSINMGHPLTNGNSHIVDAAIARILEAATTAGKYAGIFCSSGDQARIYADMGFHMINVTTDTAALQAHLTDDLKKAKGEERQEATLTGPYGR